MSQLPVQSESESEENSTWAGIKIVFQLVVFDSNLAGPNSDHAFWSSHAWATYVHVLVG